MGAHARMPHTPLRLFVVVVTLPENSRRQRDVPKALILAPLYSLHLTHAASLPPPGLALKTPPGGGEEGSSAESILTLKNRESIHFGFFGDRLRRKESIHTMNRFIDSFSQYR